MKILIVGSGGREHAIAWKLRQSPRVSRLYCAPGNAGIGEIAELVGLAADDIEGLRRFAERERIDLTVVGPELPLALGIADAFAESGLRVFGPTRAAAALESSKAFAKELMRRARIPTAFFGVFTDADEARKYVAEVGAPVVVKADGLAAGKGVIVCSTVREAEEAIGDILCGRLFGDAGNRIVIEEYLEGEEASFMAITDGEAWLPLPPSQDHKRAYDGDRGPNTGGMGACSPAPVVTPAVQQQVMDEVFAPLLHALRERDIRYRGVVYAGLMVQGERARVLEFNARFGDPECQAVLVRLQSDLLDLLDAAVDGGIDRVQPAWDPRAAVCVVLAMEGYPGPYRKGVEIHGLEKLRGWRGGVVFHAGTARRGDGYVTNGGRVLGVTALGEDLADAVAEAYRAVGEVTWDGMHFRRDIGYRALRRCSPPPRGGGAQASGAGPFEAEP